MAFGALELPEPNMVAAYHFTDDEIQTVAYYLTPVGSDPAKPDHVKLGAKCTLENGEVYGSSLQIPFATLKQLVEACEKTAQQH
jgi:hypothetical protein